jgi:ubiquinone/menaquinone biosynthesis C-methylase UbiE
MPVETSSPGSLTPVQRAFNKQAEHYDADDLANPILLDWRKRVYDHLNLFLKPGGRILELNAGTGIDAIHLVMSGHKVHATDVSPVMIQKIREKIEQSGRQQELSIQQCSFESLHAVTETSFDYIFSNFGGLNCCKDLTTVTKHLPRLLKTGGYVTWVIMPPACPWEWMQILKGNLNAFRRLKKPGVTAHLEGQYFTTYYHSLSDIQISLGPEFGRVRTEGLGSVSPPPSSQAFTVAHPGLYGRLKKLDRVVGCHFPFNRWADHIIVTFQYK